MSDPVTRIESALDQILPTIGEMKRSVVADARDPQAAVAPSLVAFRDGVIFAAAMGPTTDDLLGMASVMARMLEVETLVLVAEVTYVEPAESDAPTGLPSGAHGDETRHTAISFSCVDEEANAAFVLWPVQPGADGELEFREPEVLPPHDMEVFETLAEAFQREDVEAADSLGREVQVLMAQAARLQRRGGQLTVFAQDDEMYADWVDFGLDPEIVVVLS